MSKSNQRLIIVMLALALSVPSIVGLIAIFIAVMPREDTQRLRRRLQEFILWQWISGSRISARFHNWLANGSLPKD